MFLVLAPFNYCLSKDGVINIYNKKSLNKVTKEGSTLIVKGEVDLGGKSLTIPPSCSVIFEKGYFKNGVIVCDNTFLSGNVIIKTRIHGTLRNDTIKTSWFDYEDKVLSDVFDLAEGKVVLFDGDKNYFVNYIFYIPSCVILGNDAKITIGKIDEHSAIGKPIKIRNRHYDGCGVDSFVVNDLKFETQEDSTFLFNIMNASHVRLINCSFACYGEPRQCMHPLDIRGKVNDLKIEHCAITNMSSCKEGGGLWLRSFGNISDVTVSNCTFRTNTTDEVFAINAVTGDVRNVKVDSCVFKYERSETCLPPNVFWCVANRKGTKYENVTFSNNRLSSDFMPSYVVNSNKEDVISVDRCTFVFRDFKMHREHLFTTSFNGRIDFLDNEVIVENIKQIEDSDSHVNLFSSYVKVRKSRIFNDCENCHLGAPSLYESTIVFNNSQLFNGSLPTYMVGNNITLGRETPKLAANPFCQQKKCYWQNNTIESKKKVEFNFLYENVEIESKNNKFENINILGNQVK